MIEEKRSFRRLFFAGLFLITGILSQPLSAQDFTSSPYSRFGVGDLLNKSFGRSQAMGGLGVGLNNTQELNLINPAGLNGMDSIQFIFEVGAFDQLTGFRTTDLKKTTNDIGFSYLGMAFPITKWWQGAVGILPYSGVGYAMTDTRQDPDIGQVQSHFSGDGGISRFFLSQSVVPIQSDDGRFFVSLGFNFSYLFGPVSHSKSLQFPSDSSFFSTQSLSTAIVGDIHMDYGAQIRIPLKNDWFLQVGGIYDHQSTINTESRKLVMLSGQGIVDTLFYEENADNSIILPMGYGGGFSVGKKNKLTVGADYRVQNWQESSFLGANDQLANSRDIIIGGEYIPDIFAPSGYHKRMAYRAGVRYSETFLQLNNTQLTDIGFNFGVGLPIRPASRIGRMSALNITAEIGKRGTIENNLISELYGLISVQLTLRDTWFYKSKYD